MLTKDKWEKGEVREYGIAFNAGCCYCLGKVWRPCRFKKTLCRIGNTAYRIRKDDDE